MGGRPSPRELAKKGKEETPWEEGHPHGNLPKGPGGDSMGGRPPPWELAKKGQEEKMRLSATEAKDYEPQRKMPAGRWRGTVDIIM